MNIMEPKITKIIPENALEDTSLYSRLNKVDILILNNGWNDKNEKLIVSIGYSSSIYKNLHEKTAYRFNFFNKLINLPLLILTVFLSTNAIASFLDTEYITIRKILVFAVTLLSILNTFLNYTELSTKHLYSANSFNVIYNDIRNTMCIYRKDRQNAVKYIQTIMKEYDHLEISSLEIPRNLIRKMKSKIKTNDKYLEQDIVMPTGDFSKIEVIVENDNKIVDNEIKFKINNTQNLEDMHNCFKIDGELCEDDNIRVEELQQFQRKGFALQTEYQMNRLNNY